MKIIDDLVNENLIIAFIDTSALDPMHNNYGEMRTVFEVLKKHVDAQKIVLLTHEIVINEIKSHINNDVAEQLDNLIKIQKSKQLYLLNDCKKLPLLSNDINKQQAIDDSFKAFQEKIKELGIQVLKVGHISIKALLNDYFSNNPPFGKKDKKAEFPDAIMLQTLKSALGKDAKIHIIAKDNDWDLVCKENTQFIIHKNFSSLLDYINKDNVATSEIKIFLTSETAKSEIVKIENHIIDTLDFKVDGKIYDRKGILDGYDYDEIDLIDIFDVEYKLHTIEDIDCVEDESNTNISSYVVILGSARVVVKCKYFDESNSHWDSETHEFIVKRYGTVIEEHELLFPVRIKISGDYKKELIIESYQLLETEYNISELDRKTLIKQQFIETYDDYFYDDSFIVERILKCPYCNKDIKVNLMSGDTDCVSFQERQMGTENEYSIDIVDNCPHCKNEYKVSGHLWEYPSNTCNLIQDLKIEKI